MKRYCLLLVFISSQYVLVSQQDIFGIWKAIDDLDGQPTSHIQIFEEAGLVKGKIIKLYDQPDDVVCDLCEGHKKDMPVLGMEIIWGMHRKGNQCTGGNILDPEVGKTYKCKLKIADDGTLKVRGYIGIPAIGRTQTWHRI